jgi:acetyl esterase
MKKLHSKITCFLLVAGLSFCQLVKAEHPVIEHKDIQWAEAKGFKLTADIHVPNIKKKNLPVLVVFHGGGWLLNSKSIMSDMSNYMAANADLVVVNVNYRLLSDNNNTTTLNEMVEDALGAVLWVKDNIKQYGGNPKKIAVTGDSAGGQLAAMVILAGHKLESNGFAGATLGFKPDGARVQAGVLSYAAYDLLSVGKGGFEAPGNKFWEWAKATPRGIFGADINAENHPEFYKAVSPLYSVPNSKDRKLPPQFIYVGSKDGLTTPEVATRFVDLLKQADQPVEFKIYEGKGHGFLDSGCNDYNHGCFKDLSKPALDDAIVFLNKTFK